MRSRELLVVIAAAMACAQSDAPAIADRTASNIPESGDTTRRTSDIRDAYLITESGIGGIRLGMTLAEAQRALPSTFFGRMTDGDGVALIEVTVAQDHRLVLWADEDAAEASIDWAKPVKRIETFSPAFHTREGVHPGARVTEVENVFGKTRMIEESEIESRQYIVFAEQPAYLTLRLDYSGIFQQGERTTTRFNPDAKIMSIAISSSR